MWWSIQKVTKHYQTVILNNSLPFDEEAQIFCIQEAQRLLLWDTKFVISLISYKMAERVIIGKWMFQMTL